MPDTLSTEADPTGVVQTHSDEVADGVRVGPTDAVTAGGERETEPGLEDAGGRAGTVGYAPCAARRLLATDGRHRRHPPAGEPGGGG